VKRSASDLFPPPKALARPRTVERHETSHGLPDPSPPRMGAHADKDGKEGHDAESDGEVGQVSRAGPLDAKEAVLLFAAVADALGKVAALEVGVHDLPIARHVRYLQYLTLAPFHEAEFYDGSAVQELSPMVNEPVLSMLVYEAAIETEKRRKDEIPVVAGDGKDILGTSDKRYLEDGGGRKGRTSDRLTETRRKVTT
jgi:hypothetical protein